MKPVHIFFIIIFFASTQLSTGCKKIAAVDAPNTSINALNVYTNDVTAAAVLTGIYTRISADAFTSPSINSISLFAGLSADELTLHTGVTDQTFRSFYRNALRDDNAGTQLWNKFYPIIYTANSAIEGIATSGTLSSNVTQQLLGEAKFIRAFCYFYLINLYGDVPLVLKTEASENVLLPRTPQNEIYQQIIKDLKEAQGHLKTEYVNADAKTDSQEKSRPNKYVATALLARAYLYIQNWASAESEATAVINITSLYDTVSFSSPVKAFDKNSMEAIWQLQPVRTGQNTQDARMFVLPNSGPTNSVTNPVYLPVSFVNSFETGDLRKTNWIKTVTPNGNTYYSPYKYKVNAFNAPVAEYVMVLRIAEQYLIRAEARAQQNKISGAQSDLNVIRKRARLSVTTANDKPSLLSAILQEKRRELFTEWGHRWFDLKRTGEADAVMSVVTPQKGGIWSPNWKLYPIPRNDVQRGANIEQNIGY